MTREEYTKHFTTVTDRVLLELIDDADGADPLAVELARAELERRGLQEEELAGWRAARSLKEAGKRERRMRMDQVSDAVRSGLSEVQRTLVADASKPRSERRQLALLLIASGLQLLAYAPRYADLPWLLEGKYDLSILEHFLPLLVLPVMLWMLWRQSRSGWFLGAIMSTNAFTWALATTYWYWNTEPSGLFAIDWLFQIPSRRELLLGLLWNAGLIALFQAKSTITLFKISEQERWITIALVLALSMVEFTRF